MGIIIIPLFLSGDSRPFPKGNKNNTFFEFIIQFNVYMYMLSFMFFYIINVIQTKNNVRMVLKIQKALRIINYKNYRNLTIWNWINVLRYFGNYFISISTICRFPLAIKLFTLIYFDVYTAYGISLITLMVDGMRKWISEVEYHSKISSELHEEKYNDCCKKLFLAYVDIMEAFHVFKRIFQISVRVTFCIISLLRKYF